MRPAGMNNRYSSMLNDSTARRGTTLLEVMFAIFVVVVGLAGIASLLPMAARNASDSNAHNIAQAVGQQWFNSFFSYHMNNPRSFAETQVGYNWMAYRDELGSPRFVEFNQGEGQTLTGSVVRRGNQLARMWAHQAVCIDPMFYTETEVQSHTASNSAESGVYRLSVFPYVEDGYNPLTDPSSAANPWEDQPRMVRVTLGFDATAQASRKLVEDMFASPDELSIAADQTDRAIPPVRLFAPGGLKGIFNGQYSWMATITPREPLPIEISSLRNLGEANLLATTPPREQLLSLVVMNRRDRLFIEPGTTLVAETDEDKPAGERLTWVIPLSGSFTGGNGGRVRLVCDENTDSNLHVGDWIMLGKHYAVDRFNVSRRYSYFRWYRIIGMSRDPQIGQLSALIGANDPYGNAGNEVVWTRDVVLEGPDFDMAQTYTTGGNTYQTPVTGTIVSGVVTVVERNIRLD